MESQPLDAPIGGIGTLIRTLDGRITFWSDAMEHRYGFAAADAVGQVSHRLLRTSSWQSHDEIQAELLERQSWHGGLILRRVDGQPVIATNHWRLHQPAGDRGAIVTELHADILPAGTPAAANLADVLTTIAQELSQPLTAAHGYIGGAGRALQPAWPDRVRSDQGISKARAQLDRAAEIVQQMRELGHNLRKPRLVRSHASLISTLARTESILQRSHDLRRACRAAVVESVLARQERGSADEGSRADQVGSATPDRQAAVQNNIRLLESLLQGELDASIEHTLSQLLVQEQARLAALARQ
jgi:hypothetical protein